MGVGINQRVRIKRNEQGRLEYVTDNTEKQRPEKPAMPEPGLVCHQIDHFNPGCHS